MARVLVDIDNVVGDFVPHIFHQLAERQIEGPPPSCADCWNFFKHRFTSEAHNATIEMLNNESFWATMPLVPGAKEAVELLQAVGHEIIFVTTPWEDCVGWHWHRTDWIRRNLGKYSVVTTADKHVVDGSVLIDDRPENLLAWRQHQPGMPLLFDQLHNRADQSGFKRFTWSEVDDLVLYLQRREQTRPVTLIDLAWSNQPPTIAYVEDGLTHWVVVFHNRAGCV